MIRPFLGLLALACSACGPDESNLSERTLLAIFAHPDDESTVAPMLAKYDREGAHTHIVIATDGRLGFREFAGIEAGDALAQAREEEMRCAAEALGAELTLLGYHDQLRAAEGYDGHIPHVRALIRDVAAAIERISPDAIVTWGPDGGSNHLDHRLVGATVTSVFLSRDWGKPISLFYYGTPVSRIEDEDSRLLRGVDDRFLTTAIGYEPGDFERAKQSLECHRSQFTTEDMQQMMADKEKSGRTIYLRRFEPPTSWSDSVFPQE